MLCTGERSKPLPCIKCVRGKRKNYGEWICSQEGFRPRPISQVNNCKSLNEYRNGKKKRNGDMLKK